MLRELEIDADLRYYPDSFGFDENFKILRHSGYRESSISLWIDYGNLSDEYEVEQDCVMKDTRENRVKIKRHLTQDGYVRVSEVEGSLDELIDDIGGVNYENIEELEEVLDELGIDYTSNYLRMSTRGYSQGDYAEILVNLVEFKKMAGVKFKEDTYKKWFDHYFWDSPISGTIGVSFNFTGKGGVPITFEEEYDFNEYTDDEYDVDGLDIGVLLTAILYASPHQLNDEDIVQLRTALEKINYQDVSYGSCGC